MVLFRLVGALVGRSLRHALEIGRKWNSRWRGAPLLLAAVVLLWVGLAIGDLPAVRPVVGRWTEHAEQRAAVHAERYGVSHLAWTHGVPTVLFIDFDDDSIAAAPVGAMPGGSTGDVTLKPVIAALLDLLRADPRSRPALVFLDASPLGEESPADPGLAQALRRWASDGTSAPMAIFAGSACPSSDPAQPNRSLSPSPFSTEVLPSPGGDYGGTGGAAPPGRIVWSCPTYDGMREQLFWSCVEANDSGRTAPLLSPGWFAIAVREKGVRFLETAAPGLAAAGASCRGGRDRLRLGPGHALVAPSNPLILTFDPADTSASKLNGNPVVQTLSVREIMAARAAGGSLPHDYAGKFVVIGSTGRFRGQDDRIPTQFGDIPGPLVVAEELRSAWATGYPHGPDWWASQIVATLLVIGAFLLVQAARSAKARWGQGGTLGARLLVVLTSLHVLALIVIPLFAGATFYLGQWLFDLDQYKLAFAFLLTEILFLVTAIGREFRGESHVEASGAVVPAAGGHGQGGDG